MRTVVLGVLLLISFPSLIPSKFVEESCNTSDDACPSLLAYLLPHDSKLAEIASKFQVNLTGLVGANAFDAAKSFSGNEILPQNTLLRIPISCPCANGVRHSSTAYTVKPIDTVDSIAAEFSGLVSAEQIQTANGMWGSGGLQIGRSLVIPLPCACFENSDNGVAAIYMSYVVRQGDSLKSIGQVYGTTVSDLVAVNGLGTAFVYPADILAIPLPGLMFYSSNLLVEFWLFLLGLGRPTYCEWENFKYFV
ncbi:hypothetical protein ACLOJK_032953 [Asimina triloba]